MSKLFAVIRFKDEVTINACRLALQELDIPYLIISGTTLDKASKLTLATARITGADWVMAVDADVIITMSKKDIIEYCDEMKEDNLLSFTGYVFGTKRGLIDGIHFFNAENTEKALDIVKDRIFKKENGTTHHREESEMLWYLRDNHNLTTKQGYKRIPFGIHFWKA